MHQRKLTLLVNVTMDHTVWMFCKGQRDTSQAVTPIAKLVPHKTGPTSLALAIPAARPMFVSSPHLPAEAVLSKSAQYVV